MSAGEAAGYSQTTVEHFRSPRNVGRLADANAFGEIDDRESENYLSIYLRVDDGRITAATFRTFGCSACVAASSVVTELVRGKTVAEATGVDATVVLKALDGLPEGKRHCATLAAQALARAVASYSAPPAG